MYFYLVCFNICFNVQGLLFSLSIYWNIATSGLKDCVIEVCAIALSSSICIKNLLGCGVFALVAPKSRVICFVDLAFFLIIIIIKLFALSLNNNEYEQLGFSLCFVAHRVVCVGGVFIP